MKLSALGTMLLLSPDSDLIQWRVEHFSAAGNWKGHGLYPNKKAAQKARKATLRCHERLAKKRAENKRGRLR